MGSSVSCCLSHQFSFLLAAMTSSEEGDIDLLHQRKIRTSQQKAANRVMRSLIQMEGKGEPLILSLQRLQGIEAELETILRRAKRANGYLADEELDAELQAQDEETFYALEEVLANASQLCQELIVSKTAGCLSQEIQDSLMEAENKMVENPEKDYSAEYPGVTKLLDEMTEVLRSSTLSLDHSLREEAKAHKARLGVIRATNKESKPPTVIRAAERDQDLPKTTIKKFNGGLAEWHAFWGRFSGAVYNNENLKEHKKLALLTDLVTDPALHDYMVTANDGEPGRYQEAVDYLTGRFNRPRELHSIFCKKLSELQPIKGTPTELSAAADAVYAAVSGIRRSGFTSIDHIATSLVAPILPDHLRALWENKTEENPKVPNIDEWITFVRKKATMADKCLV